MIDFYKNSNFEITSDKGKVFHEIKIPWSDISTERVVKIGDKTKIVRVNNSPASKITVKHNELETTLEIPEGCEVYQCINAESTFIGNKKMSDNIIGRTVGIIKDGEIIEERFLNGQTHSVIGWKK
jgi:uncharacterized protein YxjI